MKLRGNVLFPYPVLSGFTDDYTKCTFDAMIAPIGEQGKEPESWKIHFRLSEEKLLNLVKREQAQYAIEIICNKTFYRHIEKSFDDQLEISIPKGALQGRVEMNALLICVEPEERFQSSNFNQEYGEGFSFDMRLGYVLAMDAYSYYFDFSRVQPFGSVFVLKGDENATEGIFSVDLNEEKIAIVVHPDDRDSFQEMRKQKNLREVVLTGIYLPVLVEVLREMVGEDWEAHTDKKWYRTIQHQLDVQGHNLALNDCFEVAQQLLKSPFGRLIRAPLGQLNNG